MGVGQARITVNSVRKHWLLIVRNLDKIFLTLSTEIVWKSVFIFQGKYIIRQCLKENRWNSMQIRHLTLTQSLKIAGYSNVQNRKSHYWAWVGKTCLRDQALNQVLPLIKVRQGNFIQRVTMAGKLRLWNSGTGWPNCGMWNFQALFEGRLHKLKRRYAKTKA